MGDFRVRNITDDYDRNNMYHHALDDIEAFDLLLKEKMFVQAPVHIGAEQELCLVDKEFEPHTKALEILDKIEDERYTNELALFNLEINADPKLLNASCFSDMENELAALIKMGRKVAWTEGAHILKAGILPTLAYRHLQFEYMTPIKRYQTLSNTLFDLRGQNFEIYLQGTDELLMSLSSVLFEACNTSFQTHLQIDPDNFVNMHNWAQMIAGPVLSTSVNSPLLFGNELWHETRIALFKQSLDTRSSTKFLRRKLPRVYFGNGWIKNSPADLWKNDIMRFPLILTSDDFKKSTQLLKNGEIPELRAIRLHNGTTYTWNRMCFGHSKKQPHLRIECRYLPSGPSLKDEIANFAFWIGLMSCPDRDQEFWKDLDFRTAKNNFIKAARTGINTIFNWYGEMIPANKLILEKLLPMAESGLKKYGVDDIDIKQYLGIIEKRTEKNVTGSEWLVHNHRKLTSTYGETLVQKSLVKKSLEYQVNNIPVHEWENLKDNIFIVNEKEERVEEYMSRDIFSVHEYDSIELVKKILSWNNIHHLPVEGKNGDLVGLITDGIVERLDSLKEQNINFASQVMILNPVTIAAYESLDTAKQCMKDHNLKGLPVVYKKKLVGIITDKDFKR